jgi:hypothetical protein
MSTASARLTTIRDGSQTSGSPGPEVAEQSPLAGHLLVYKTGALVKIGDVAQIFRGEAARAHGWAPPHLNRLAECS